jgi:hypothetical protein
MTSVEKRKLRPFLAKNENKNKTEKNVTFVLVSLLVTLKTKTKPVFNFVFLQILN